MLKDKVIKPLLVATEKVVDYYFPEQEDQAMGTGLDLSMAEPACDKAQSEMAAVEGAATKPGTFNDDQSCCESYESDMSRLKNTFSKLTMNAKSYNNLAQGLVESEALKSPRSHSSHAAKMESPISSNLKKRRVRQLERWDLFDNDSEDIGTTSSKEENKSAKRSLKFNKKLLKKASATVDLISQKVKSQNVIQQTVSASFVTNVIELTNDALKSLALSSAIDIPQ